MDNMGNDIKSQNNDISYIDICDSPPEWQELLRLWRNKPHVRSEMCIKEEISHTEHALWLKKVLASESTDKIRIAVSNGVPFGMVRLKDIDRENFSSDWGFYIGEELFLGLGLGKKMLMYLIDWAFAEEILKELHTKVNKNNIKALSIYREAGFCVTGETGVFLTMSLISNGETKIWMIGHGGNGREMPLEFKRRFAWVFASKFLPICIDNGAAIEIRSDSTTVHLNWRDIVFKLSSHSDIEILSEKMPYADVLIPKTVPKNCDWGFIAFDTKNDLGFSVLLAASMEVFKKTITFCDNSTNFTLSKNHTKIEILTQEHKDSMEELCRRFDNLSVFVEFSLTGVDNPLELTEKIVNNSHIKGMSVRNDLPASEKELPEKIIEMIQGSGFKGSAQNRIYIGYRE
jgi:RimJ/RimL family protein N-acetyltransferase